MKGARGWARRGITPIEYLILLLLVAIVLIGIARVLGWTVAEKFGGGSVEIEAIQDGPKRGDDDLYDLSPKKDRGRRRAPVARGESEGDRVIVSGALGAGGGGGQGGGVSAAGAREKGEGSGRANSSFELAGSEETIKGGARGSARGPDREREGAGGRRGAGEAGAKGRLKDYGLGPGADEPSGDTFHPATLGAALLILLALGGLLVVRGKKGEKKGKGR